MFILKYRVFLGCPVLKTLHFHSWVWVQSLVGELRSCMPHGTIKLYIYYICKKIVIIYMCVYTHTHVCVCVCVVSCVQLFATLWSVASSSLQPIRLLSPWNSPGKNTGVGCDAPLQGFSSPRDWIDISCISCIAGGFFTTEWPGKPMYMYNTLHYMCWGCHQPTEGR